MWRAVAACLAVPAVAAMLQPSPAADRDWKRWLDDVRPLVLPDEEKAVLKLPVADREGFREAFWRRRAPDPTSTDNERRVAYERRVQIAEPRFRDSKGAWNDCGRTFLLLGKPDSARKVTDTSQRAGGAASEVWTYRNSPRLPQTAGGYVFSFSSTCGSLGGATFQQTLRSVAATYVSR